MNPYLQEFKVDKACITGSLQTVTKTPKELAGIPNTNSTNGVTSVAASLNFKSPAAEFKHIMKKKQGRMSDNQSILTQSKRMMMARSGGDQEPDQLL